MRVPILPKALFVLPWAAIIVTLAACGAGHIPNLNSVPTSDDKTSALATADIVRPQPAVSVTSLPIVVDKSQSTAGVYLGAACGVGAEITCRDFASVMRHGIAYGTVYATWDDDLASVISAENFVSWWQNGITPEITWQPSSTRKAITYAEINNGDYDAYLRASAREIKAFRHPILLRPFHELNGRWYSWGLANNGANSEADAAFIQAWRRMYGIFQQEGATNAKFIWCFANASVPNTKKAPWNDPANAYPGDAYVHWIGFDAYNRGNKLTGMLWNTFDATISASYQKAVAIAGRKPIMLGELASNEYGDGGAMKAAWVTRMFSELRSPTASNAYPHIRAITWFETDDTRFIYNSASTLPVYDGFALAIRTYGPSGVLDFRSNTAAFNNVAAP